MTGRRGFERPAPPHKTDQVSRVGRMLAAGWVCAVEFAHHPPDGGSPILRYGSSIHRLRKRGWVIVDRVCEKHRHPESSGQIREWHAVAIPTSITDEPRCPLCGGILGHRLVCPTRVLPTSGEGRLPLDLGDGR